MKLLVYKNQYGYFRVQCPFCGEGTYYRERRGRDPLLDLRRHFINRAKQEALDCYLAKYQTTPPHLKYMQEHAKEKIIMPTTAKYQFDNDLEVEKTTKEIKETK